MKRMPFAYVRPDVTYWTNVRQPIPGYHPVQAAMGVAWQFTAAPQFGIEVSGTSPVATATVTPPVNGAFGYAPGPYAYGFSDGEAKPRLVDRVKGWLLKRRIQRAAALVATAASTPIATAPTAAAAAPAGLPFQPGTLHNTQGYAWGRPPMQPVMSAAMGIMSRTTAAATHPPTSTPILTAEQHGAVAVPVAQQWTQNLPTHVAEQANWRGWRQFVNPSREAATTMPQAPAPPPLPSLDDDEEH